MIWKDDEIAADDPNCFFFKEDPVTYLSKLVDQGWYVSLYGLYNQDLVGYPPTANEAWINIRLHTIINTIIAGVNTPPFEKLYDPNDYSSASFTISNQPLSNRFINYTPFEIFGLTDPLIKIPKTIYFHMTNSLAHDDLIRRKLDSVIGLAGNRGLRLVQIEHFKDPRRPIVIIWSPVYSYNDHQDYIAIKQFERPDQDPPIPEVTYYTWGF